MADLGKPLEVETLCLVTGRDFRWTLENKNDAGVVTPWPAGDLYVELETGGEHNCVQQVSILQSEDGTYTLAYDGDPSDPIDYYDAISTPYDLTIDVRSALENITAIGAGNVEVSRTGLDPVWNLNFTLTGTSQNEIQELSVVNLLGWLGEALGEGEMVLEYRSNDSEPISFESSAAEIEAALEEIPQIGVGNVNVTEPTSGKFNIEFVNLLAARDVDQVKVRAYEKNSSDFFGGGLVGTLLTTLKSKTIQNGRRAVLDGRMMDTLTQKVTEFFNLFDSRMPISLEFVINSSTDFTIVVRSNKGFAEVDLMTFDVLFSGTTLKSFLDNQILLSGAVSTLTVDQYWNHRYTVEFINDLANKPHPLLVGDASLLTNTITEITVTPEVNVEILELGQAPITKWDFVIDGATADLKVESEYADLIQPRTRWQLVHKPTGEAAGGDPKQLGRVYRQPN